MTPEKKLAKKIYDQKRYLENRSEIIKRVTRHRDANWPAFLAREKRRRDANPEKSREKGRAARRKYRAISRIRERRRLKEDPGYRAARNCRLRLRDALRAAAKDQRCLRSRTVQLIGCGYKELRSYLESKFQPGMTWENYGINGWHIDHIKPLSRFNLLDENELKRASHYTNLQPLWAADNFAKSDHYEEPLNAGNL